MGYKTAIVAPAFPPQLIEVSRGHVAMQVAILGLADLIVPGRALSARIRQPAVLLQGVLLIGVLMVSTFRYYSFKKFDLRQRWSFRALIPIAAIVLVIIYLPHALFLALAVTYTLSAPVSWLIGRLRGGHRPEDPEAPVPPEDSAPPPVPETGP